MEVFVNGQSLGIQVLPPSGTTFPGVEGRKEHAAHRGGHHPGAGAEDQQKEMAATGLTGAVSLIGY